jgi:hypothetical protein
MRTSVLVVAVITTVALAFRQDVLEDGGTQQTFDLGAFGRTASAGVDRPSPAPATSDTPLGIAPDPPPDDRHRFIETLPNGDPVTYDPCRPIAVVVNDRAAPVGHEVLLDGALDAVSAATGLQFVVEGSTDEPASAGRSPMDRARYGDRWSPVLVSWTDPEEVGELDGDIAGIGGSTWTSASSSDDLTYVSGLVALDGPQLADRLAGPDGPAVVRSVVIHELGHLVGLDHVDADDQLMFARSDVTTLQPGDLAGLARLGRGRCFSEL